MNPQIVKLWLQIICQKCMIMKKRRSSNLSNHLLSPLILWSSRAYTGVTIHCITSEYELESSVLETKEFQDFHTAKNIADELSTIEFSTLNANVLLQTTAQTLYYQYS